MIVICSFLLSLSACGGSDSNSGQKVAISKKTIKTIWANTKPSYIASLRASLENQNTKGLYNVQIMTRNILGYAHETKNIDLLDDLSELYLTAFDYLKLEDTYTYYYLPGKGRTTELALDKPVKMWKSKSSIESVLDVSQFLIAVSQTLNFILDINEKDRTQNMNNFLVSYPEVVIDHYDRWVFEDKIFQRYGWGCAIGVYSHLESIKKLLDKSYNERSNVSYCNSVRDTDLFIIAGVSELLAANKKSPNYVALSSDAIERYKSYLNIGSQLLESRISRTPVTNFEGGVVMGANFDLSAWDDHSSYAYSGYLGEYYPTKENKKSIKRVGWDFSHASRFVTIFESLRRNQHVTKQTFPSNQTLTEFSNQIAYKVFNGDLKNPKFSNFMSGANGWFRVGYSNREGFGYMPSNMSNVFLTGGFAFWRKYNKDFIKILDASWDAALNKADEDNIFKYGCVSEYKPSCENDYHSYTSKTLINALASYPYVFIHE